MSTLFQTLKKSKQIRVSSRSSLGLTIVQAEQLETKRKSGNGTFKKPSRVAKILLTSGECPGFPGFFWLL